MTDHTPPADNNLGRHAPRSMLSCPTCGRRGNVRYGGDWPEGTYYECPNGHRWERKRRRNER